MLRKLLKRSQWPPVYEADIRVWIPSAAMEEVRSIPLLLPHEVVRAFCLANPNKEALLSREALDPNDLEQLRRVETGTRQPAGTILALGLWLASCASGTGAPAW
eukprot:647675-Lingulodinium_polyedra.AAC.1